MSGRCDEVQAAVDPVVGHGPAVHPGLRIQEVLAFTVDVVDNWLPAGETSEHETGLMRILDNGELVIICGGESDRGGGGGAHQLLLSTASPNPGVSTMVSVSWTPPSLINTLDCST